MTVFVCGIVLCVLLFVDLVTKMLAHAYRVSQNHFFLGIVRLKYTENAGFAFGMAADNRIVMIFITIFTILLIIGIGVLFFTVYKHNRFARGVLAVIEAGALGNLIDRLYFGWVRDFIEVVEIRIGNWRIVPTYICNVADIYIVFGAVLLIFMILFIGPHAIFPLTKEWREEAKRIESEREVKKLGLGREEKRPSEADDADFEEVVVFRKGASDEQTGAPSGGQTEEDQAPPPKGNDG